jgi:hypothetical protein
MKQSIADREQRFDGEDSARGKANANANASHDFRGFAKQLRALGQALEKFSFSTFDLELQSGIYVITGRAAATEQVKFSFSRFVRELFRGARAQPTVTYTQNQIDLRFSPAEIEQFDFGGRAKRRDSSRMPDPYSVSQILRGAGSYLDNRDIANLVGITLRGKWVSVSYETAEGRLEEAKQDLEYFYNYWVKMYMRRSNRTKLPAPSEPTLFVTWEGIQKAYGVAEAP